jgi:hypothetical protein
LQDNKLLHDSQQEKAERQIGNEKALSEMQEALSA